MKKMKIILSLIILNFILIGNGFSQNEAFFLGHSSGVGGRALSMGSAYLAVSDDYSATLWNPAGLTQLRRMELFTSISHLKYSNEAGTEGSKVVDKTTKTKINSFGYAFPIPTYRGSLVFAVGYNRVRGLDNGFQYSQHNDVYDEYESFTEVEEGGIDNWVVAGAMEVSEKISVGAVMNIWRGKDDYHYNMFFEDINNVYTYEEYQYDQQIVTKYNAVNFKIGVLYKFLPFLRFGATLSTPVTLKANEKWSEMEEQTGDVDNSSAAYSYNDWGEWDYKLKSPYSFAAGAAFKLLPNFIISGDAEFNDWSQMRYESEPPVGNKFRENLDFKQNYRATTTIRVGGEFTIPFINTQLRAGAIRQPSPLKNATNEMDRNYLTTGVGILLDKQVKLDIAWIHGLWEYNDVYVYDNLPLIDENIKLDKFFGTISIRF